ncbi:CPBP family intramembrane glutamic endopeptidase [Ancylomarina longa]|uniref:CPBP family intramembrane metalloprotease n=1 Tax=Ancylomarina longa TaxID=2487017 RepID=A0A434ATL3_9BACT|nr:CPBP family intramembrane glutamic endopeptidase [Ancylomarina longa]RUT77752.1 CPBP family intramembrane metalloprotease [Ancylomarina longa]
MNPTIPNPTIKKGWLRALLILIPFFIFMAIFQTLGVLIWDFMSETNPLEIFQNQSINSDFGFLIIETFTTLGTILIVWIFTRFIDREKMIKLGFSIKKQKKNILLGLLTGFLLMFIGTLFLLANKNLVIDNIEFHSLSFLVSILLFLLVALNEEIIVRGYILRNFMYSMNRYLALVLSSLVFMSLHLFNPNISFVGLLNIFLAGLLLGITYIFTKNLWFPIALHFSWNFFQGPIFGYEVSGTTTSSLISQTISGNEILTGGKFGMEGSILASLLCSIAIFIFWWIYKKKDIISVQDLQSRQ